MSHLVYPSYYRSLRDLVLCRVGRDVRETAAVIEMGYDVCGVRGEAQVKKELIIVHMSQNNTPR